PRRMTSHLLVRDEQHANRRMWHLMLAQEAERMDGDSNASLHVEHAWSRYATVGNTKRHLFERAHFPHGIDVAEKKHRLALRHPGKVGLNMIPCGKWARSNRCRFVLPTVAYR